MEKKLITVADSAESLSVSRDTIRRLITRGTLKSVRIGRRVMIPVSELERLAKPQR
ncbi:MAG: helix-turn-helix domain-containing protein [Acidobacteriia bacterium]|nr:helix-turn-helix domain-containing protein [Terriglobia bacterium]